MSSTGAGVGCHFRKDYIVSPFERALTETKKASLMRIRNKKKPLVHYLFTGCLKSRRRKKKFEFATKINEVTCPQCLNIINRKGLVGRDHFPKVPTFEVKIKDGVAVFICPVCGKENRHGPGSGGPFCDHVVSHCDCWDRGYYIQLSCPPPRELHSGHP